jgi:ABC-type branched-subunit amino acid transport system ATPase component
VLSVVKCARGVRCLLSRFMKSACAICTTANLALSHDSLAVQFGMQTRNCVFLSRDVATQLQIIELDERLIGLIFSVADHKIEKKM